MSGEVAYCDDYEAITGKKISVVKVVGAPAEVQPVPATLAETK